MENGRIEEQGTYQELMGSFGEFARLIKEFGGKEKDEEEDLEADVTESRPLVASTAIDEQKVKSESKIRRGAGTGKLEGRLIRSEKRTTGSVSMRSKCLRHDTHLDVESYFQFMLLISRQEEDMLPRPFSLFSWSSCKRVK